MAAADVLVLGGSGAGKTHYAGQLLGRLRNARHGALRLRPGGTDDLGKFDEVLACLDEGRAAGHTPAQTWVSLKCHIQARGGGEVLLEWPDYAGEKLASIVDSRSLGAEWRKSISESRAWLLFIRPSNLRLYEDLLTRPTGLTPERSRTAGSPILCAGWDDRARYVEMLQMMLFASGRATFERTERPRLAIVLSCWDELEDNGTPEHVFRERLSLLDSFVRSNWAPGSWSVWGLSALGRSLSPDSRDDDYARAGPENFGYVIRPGETVEDSDLTAPLAWLLEP